MVPGPPISVIFKIRTIKMRFFFSPKALYVICNCCLKEKQLEEGLDLKKESFYQLP